jgi:putative transcriptional regulator
MAMIRQPENFPETVKEVRRQLALSQEELAHALGVSFATANHWENGKGVPSKLAQRQFEQFCEQMNKQGKLKHGQD